MLKTRYW